MGQIDSIDGEWRIPVVIVLDAEEENTVVKNNGIGLLMD